MSSWTEIIASGGFGLVAGGLSGFLGIGGGAVLPPLLVVVLGIEQHRAQGISLAALVPPVGLPAVLAYRRHGIVIHGALVALLVLGFVIGGPVGGWLAHRVPARELRWLFAVFLLGSAWRALRSAAGPPETPDPPDAPTVTAPPLGWGLPIGLLAGGMSGLLGVGGGIVALPLLRRFGRLGRLEAQATTLAMMLPPIGLPAVFLYAREQSGLPWALLGVVACGFALGAGAGARITRTVSPRAAAVVYGSLLVLIASLLVLPGLR